MGRVIHCGSGGITFCLLLRQQKYMPVPMPPKKAMATAMETIVLRMPRDAVVCVPTEAAGVVAGVGTGGMYTGTAVAAAGSGTGVATAALSPENVPDTERKQDAAGLSHVMSNAGLSPLRFKESNDLEKDTGGVEKESVTPWESMGIALRSHAGRYPAVTEKSGLTALLLPDAANELTMSTFQFMLVYAFVEQKSQLALGFKLTRVAAGNVSITVILFW